MSYLKKFGEMLRARAPLKEKMTQARLKLDEQKESLEYMADKLQERDKDIFQKCIQSQLSKDTRRAKLYATECAEIKKIAKIVLTSQLALERVIIRLKTIEEFGEVLVQVAPVMDIVRETKDNVKGIIPEVATELEQVNTMLHDMSLETGEIEDQALPSDQISMEAEGILKESNIIAEEIMKEKFPEPKVREKEKLMVTSEGGNETLEDTIYQYIQQHDGKISLSRCSRKLNVSINLVKKTVNKLAEKGKIELE